MGRQLFISKEIHSLNTTQTQLKLPHEVCIMLVDENLTALKGELWLRYLKDGEWLDCDKEEITTGSWLFSQVPTEQESYRVYGEAEGYFDPLLTETQNMSEEDLLTYHYHILLLPVDFEIIVPNGDTALKELLSTGDPHWLEVLTADTVFIPPNGGGSFGWWTGHFIWKSAHPFTEWADLFTFTNPQFAAQHIYRLTAHYLVGMDFYRYGEVRAILKTHGHTYYGEYFMPMTALEEREVNFPVNPHTWQPWTKKEVTDLQLGISMDKEGSYGNLICDKIHIALHYL